MILRPENERKASERDPRKLKLNENQVRKKRDQQSALTASVREFDILQPLLIDANDCVLAGAGRLLAALEVGLTVVPVYVLSGDLADYQKDVLAIVENEIREGLSEPDLVRGLGKIRAETKMSQVEIAKYVHIGESKLSKCLAVLDADPRIREAFFNGSVGLSDAYELGKAPVENLAALLEQRLSGRIKTRDALATAVHALNNPVTPREKADRLDKARLPLPTGICVTVAGKELTLESLAEALTQTLDGVKKAIKQALDIKTACRVFADKSKAVGS